MAKFFKVVAALAIVPFAKAKLKRGDVKPEDFFGTDLADLQKRKFIVECEAPTEEIANPEGQPKESTETGAQPEAQPEAGAAAQAKDGAIKMLMGKTKDELIAMATEKGIEVTPELNKAQLSELIYNKA